MVLKCRVTVWTTESYLLMGTPHQTAESLHVLDTHPIPDFISDHKNNLIVSIRKVRSIFFRLWDEHATTLRVFVFVDLLLPRRDTCLNSLFPIALMRKREALNERHWNKRLAKSEQAESIAIAGKRDLFDHQYESKFWPSSSWKPKLLQAILGCFYLYQMFLWGIRCCSIHSFCQDRSLVSIFYYIHK